MTTRKAASSLLFIAILSLTGCSGTIANLVQAPAISSVTVSCVSTSVQTGQTSQCSAKVNGTGSFSQSVNWSAASGTITSSGLYTAPASMPASGSDTIKATSTQNSTKYGTANISIATAAIQPTVSSVSVLATPSSITTAQTSTCSATVTGTGSYSTAVTWTATGGTITAGGVFTPSGTGTGSCTAHSAQTGYTNISGAANITVTSAAFTITSISVVATPASITTAQTTTCAATVSRDWSLQLRGELDGQRRNHNVRRSFYALWIGDRQLHCDLSRGGIYKHLRCGEYHGDNRAALYHGCNPGVHAVVHHRRSNRDLHTDGHRHRRLHEHRESFG